MTGFSEYIASVIEPTLILLIMYTGVVLGLFLTWRCSRPLKRLQLQTIERFRKTVTTMFSVWFATVLAILVFVIIDFFYGDFKAIEKLWHVLRPPILGELGLGAVFMVSSALVFFVLMGLVEGAENGESTKWFAHLWRWILDEQETTGGKGPHDGETERECRSSAIQTMPDGSKNADAMTTALPPIEQQLECLEAKAAKLAAEGSDVTALSRQLDMARSAIAKGEVSLNATLNGIRGDLYRAPIRKRESEKLRPYLILLWELLIIGFWVYLGAGRVVDIRAVLLATHWRLLETIEVGGISGSIGAAGFAIYGWYIHMNYRNFDCALVPWYLARPFLGVILGAFISILAVILLSGLNVQGIGGHVVTIGLGFLAGSSEKFAASMINRFTARVLGESRSV